MVGRTCQRAKF